MSYQPSDDRHWAVTVFLDLPAHIDLAANLERSEMFGEPGVERLTSYLAVEEYQARIVKVEEHEDFGPQ